MLGRYCVAREAVIETRLDRVLTPHHDDVRLETEDRRGFERDVGRGVPSVVAPDTETLGSRFRLVNCETSEAGQPHCVASKWKSGGPISSRQ